VSAGVRVDLVCRLASGLIRCVGWRRRWSCVSAGVDVDRACRLASTSVVRVGWRRRWSCVSAGVDVGRARRPISTEAVVRYRPRCEGKNEWRKTSRKNTEIEKVRIFSSAPVVHVGWCQG
jgi:hypothetical protein